MLLLYSLFTFKLHDMKLRGSFNITLSFTLNQIFFPEINNHYLVLFWKYRFSYSKPNVFYFSLPLSEAKDTVCFQKKSFS